MIDETYESDVEVAMELLVEVNIDDDELAEVSCGGTLLELEMDDVSVTSLVDGVFDPIVLE